MNEIIERSISPTRVNSVTVFCGSSSGSNNAFSDAASSLGKTLATRGIKLIYGGGRSGLMGILADSALASKGTVIGVIPDFLKNRELAHPGLTDLHVVSNMHERKQKMFDLAEAFIVLPGGIGTLEEAFEVLTWKQLKRHTKPIIIVNTDSYWSPLDALIKATITDQFANPSTQKMYRLVKTAEEAVICLV
ncbi:MAG: TIGR00730 family Rossman fold protein [Pseudomonadota bacterium]|nr:TIGR00730 family Rossman fold protein [Pseudomonadota bacterium]